MKMSWASILLLLLVALAPRAFGQSFDCSKATKKVEQGICGSADLHKLDSDLNVDFGRWLEASPPDERKSLIADERRWIRARDQQCTGVSSRGEWKAEEWSTCLSPLYRQRIELLRAHVLLQGSWKAAAAGWGSMNFDIHATRISFGECDRMSYKIIRVDDHLQSSPHEPFFGSEPYNSGPWHLIAIALKPVLVPSDCMFKMLEFVIPSKSLSHMDVGFFTSRADFDAGKKAQQWGYWAKDAERPASSADGLIDQIVGYYGEESGCTSLEGDELVPCVPAPEDCLKIEKLDEHRARVTMSSIQTNGHSCSLDGIAIAEHNGLHFPETITTDSPGVMIRVYESEIDFEYDSHFTPFPGYCGMRASLENVRFKRSNRQDLNHACEVN